MEKRTGYNGERSNN